MSHKKENYCKFCKSIININRKYCKDCWNKHKQLIVSTQPKHKSKKHNHTINENHYSLCQNCEKKIKYGNKVCNSQCHNDLLFKQRCQIIESQGYWHNDKKFSTSTSFLKRYLKYKHGNKCSICGLDANWNNKPLVLILDHINGIPNDWSLLNIRLVCPNCDSQLPTFKSKNRKNGGRSKKRSTSDSHTEGS